MEEKQSLSVKDSSISFVLSFILSQIALIIFAVIGILICKANGYNSSAFYAFTSKDLGYLISVIIMNFVFIAVFLIFKHKKTDKLASKVKFHKMLLYIAVAVASYFILYPVVISFNTLFKIKSTSIEISGVGYIYSIFSRVLIPAICEELLFRGIIFKGLANSNKQLAIFVSALMFCIFHMSSEQLIYPLLMGLLLGVIMAYEDNIIYCIIVHIINNSLALAGVGYYFSHWTFYLLAGICFVLFVGAILFFALKNSQKLILSKQDAIYLLVSIILMIVFWFIVNFAK